MQETQETWVWFLGQEDPLEEEMAAHSSILAWEIPWTATVQRIIELDSTEQWSTSFWAGSEQPFVIVESLSRVWLSVTPEAWRAAVHGVTKSQTRPSDWTELNWTELHARLPRLSLSPWVHSNSGPLIQWCHPNISSSVVPFTCLQSFPASRFLLRSLFFTSGGQSIGASASASVLPKNIQGWFPLGLTGLISLQSKDSQNPSPVSQFKNINSSVLSLL